MRFYRELLESAGLSHQGKELAVLVFGSAAIVSALVLIFTNVFGLAICIGILVLAAAIEVLRLKGHSRQEKFDQLWPQVYDSFQNATQSGIALSEQLEYLAESGPYRLRKNFAQLGRDLDRGEEIQTALANFRQSIGSRHADFLALLIELGYELGGHGMAQTWQQAATDLRQEQALLGQVLAKQGWVSGSAKIALIAPWLIALVLIQLPQNKAAFASELGSIVLVLGLLLSLVAYALVNKMGSLTMPGRLFHGS